MSLWRPVLPGVWVYRDSCNVYGLQGPEGMLLVDAGTGAWLRGLEELPSPPAALACTHYFRDHSAGAAVAARAGIPVYAPEGEAAIFRDPAQHFRQRETYIIYDNLWDLYAPIEPVPLAGLLRDYERIRLAGLEVEVIPLPGATLTQSGLGVTLADGRRVALCGETIHSPGKLPRVAPLQYNYNDLGGALQCAFSARTLRNWRPDALLPSLGEPIVREADGALVSLMDNLRALLSARPWMKEVMNGQEAPPLQRVTDHVWLDTRSMANTWYLVSSTGKALAIDYGYNRSTAEGWQGYSRPERRRALLHGLEGLKEQCGVDRIDVVLVSHFHDDHVSGIPLLQRLHGTECWAAESFADLLEHPEAHCFPCNWPVPCRVERRLSLAEPFQWEEYTFRIAPMSGHTRFAALIGFEADGKRFAHTGDQYFFNNGVEDFAKSGRMQNHVYRNGALLDGYRQSGAWMEEWRPDIVIQGHQPAMFTNGSFFEQIRLWNQEYEELHRLIMPLGDGDAHFDLDSWGGWIWPYRTHLSTVASFSVRIAARNPLPRPAELVARLVGPSGWLGEERRLRAGPRAEVSCELTMAPAGPCRRQPIALELTVDSQPYGQVAEALVTIGEELF